MLPSDSSMLNPYIFRIIFVGSIWLCTRVFQSGHALPLFLDVYPDRRKSFFWTMCLGVRVWTYLFRGHHSTHYSGSLPGKGEQDMAPNDRTPTDNVKCHVRGGLERERSLPGLGRINIEKSSLSFHDQRRHWLLLPKSAGNPSIQSGYERWGHRGLQHGCPWDFFGHRLTVLGQQANSRLLSWNRIGPWRSGQSWPSLGHTA